MSQMEIGSVKLKLDRKAIKHLHISVVPPDGRVKVSAPRQMTDTAIRTAVASRIGWIRKQQRDFRAQARQSDRQMVSGECHYLWGRPCRLRVVERQGRHEVILSGKNTLRLYVQPGTSIQNKQSVLAEHGRTLLKAEVERLLKIWSPKIGATPSFWGIKKMKTKWGSCNTYTKRIWLNLELVKKPPECLDYMLVHELVHLLERHHNERFKAHIDRLIPSWRERRNLLNSLPLAFENWSY